MRRYLAASVAAGACLVLLFVGLRGKGAIVGVPGGGALRAHSPAAALRAVAERLGVPVAALVLRTRQLHPPQTQHYHAAMPAVDFTPGRHVVLLRPLRGDHYHQRVAFKVDGTVAPPWHDVAASRGVPWEDPASARCGRFAYDSARGLHVGFHTHCDGIAHSHPWTAPHALRSLVGGGGHTTGLLLDAMGVEYGPREPPRLRLPGRAALPTNRTHSWQLVVCHDGVAVLRVAAHLDRVWYPVHGVALVFSYGRTHDTACALSSAVPPAHGFDAYPYPSLRFSE